MAGNKRAINGQYDASGYNRRDRSGERVQSDSVPVFVRIYISLLYGYNIYITTYDVTGCFLMENGQIR